MSHTAPIDHVSWSSRWTFIMAATGSAVGLGNIWKFPYITGEYGGGAFVLVYLFCIALVGIPVMIAEIVIGRHGRSNPIDATAGIAVAAGKSKLWGGVGLIGALAGLLIMAFYSVIAGWSLEYIVEFAQGKFVGADADKVGSMFSGFLSDTNELIAWHSVFSALTAFVVAAGVTRGLGNAVRILMPILFILLIALLVFSFQHGDFMAAVNFMFAVDFSKLTGEAVLVALGHAFFTLSLGMTAIMVYGSYMPSNASIAKTALTVAMLDTVIALAAGLAIFPLVFANGIEPSAGPGLMFVSLPIAFGAMDGGLIFGTLFFILVGVAALSSAISLIEPSVAFLTERFGLPRIVSTSIITLSAWGLGVACIYSNNWLGEGENGFFEQLDHITANILLPLGGLTAAVLVGWVMKRKHVREELKDLSLLGFNLWYGTTRVITPIAVIIIFAHSLGLFET